MNNWIQTIVEVIGTLTGIAVLIEPWKRSINKELADISRRLSVIEGEISDNRKNFVTKDTCDAHTKRHEDISIIQEQVLRNSEDIARLKGILQKSA